MHTQSTAVDGSRRGPTADRDDYVRVARAIRFIDAHREQQPSLAAVAEHVGLSAHHFQRLFRRWSGVTPKQFLSYLTVRDAKVLLAAGQPVLAVSDSVGLSGPSRLHDAFVAVEALSPGEYARRGAPLRMRSGVWPSPFGAVAMLRTARGICALEFIDGDPEAALARLRADWQGATFEADLPDEAAALVQRIFSADPGGDARGGLRLQVRGTNFQVKVWSALLSLAPRGATVRYADVARAIGQPRAARAVGSAVAANPVAWLIPCHRVIRSVGGLGGYRWGAERKRLMLAWERASATWALTA